MSIIIEDKRDIELLIEFFEKFNLSRMFKVTTDTSVEEVLEQRVTKQDLVKSLNEVFDAVDIKIKEHDSKYVHKKDLNNLIADHMKMIEEAVPSLVHDALNEPQSEDKTESTFIRDYAPSVEPFKIFGMTNEGCFVNCNGNFLNFSLKDVKTVRKYISRIDKYPTWVSLEEVTGIPKDLLKRMCLTYELGTFDDYLSYKVTGLTKRLYPKGIGEKVYKITGMTDEGKFLNSWNGEYFWDIQTILKLKTQINNYNEYPTGASMNKLIDTQGTTGTILSYMLENHYFDKYLFQWEQIEANNYFGNWKQIPMENNPQKRKENGMV